MYELMNKDHVVAHIETKKGLFSTEYKTGQVFDRMPFGSKDIEKWLENRKASKHNRRLRELMVACGCEKTEGYIRITHAATLNDTFWVRKAGENVGWCDISLYRNNFNETISRLAFEGAGLYGLQISDTSPELTTSGSFRKCWTRENNDIFLYKRGTEGASNAGLEPYCEAMASELAKAICRDAVEYQCVRYRGAIASRCKLFTDEEKGYVPCGIMLNTPVKAENLLAFYKGIDEEEEFKRMLVLDALTLNTDRHLNNHGVLVDNDTQEILKMAPVFDMNLSLLPYCTKDDFANIGKRVKECSPSIGDDFTQTARAVITPSIRADLINMKGFTFSFRGDDVFPEWRVKALEEMVNCHIDAILGRSQMITSDVFLDKEDEIIHRLETVASKMEELSCVEYTAVIREPFAPPHLEVHVANDEYEDIWLRTEGKSGDIKTILNGRMEENEQELNVSLETLNIIFAAKEQLGRLIDDAEPVKEQCEYIGE